MTKYISFPALPDMGYILKSQISGLKSHILLKYFICLLFFYKCFVIFFTVTVFEHNTRTWC